MKNDFGYKFFHVYAESVTKKKTSVTGGINTTLSHESHISCELTCCQPDLILHPFLLVFFSKSALVYLLITKRALGNKSYYSFSVGLSKNHESDNSPQSSGKQETIHIWNITID